MFNGIYIKFSVEWYRNSGSALILTAILTIFTVSFGKWIFIAFDMCKRCCDRGGDCFNEKKTKKLTQEAYEDVNMGRPIDFVMRYNVMINSLFLTMMFSSGMPILYPIAAVYTIISYWVDKYMILRHYRKSPSFDSQVSETSL